MNVIALTDIGLVREKNQDSVFSSDKYDLPLYIIADGMGGYKGGEIASSDAINIIKRLFIENQDKLTNKKFIKTLIEDSIKEANLKIYRKSLEFSEYSGMGTTISLCYIYRGYVFVGHVGDSRTYKIYNDSIEQITEDHSLVNELIKKGEITKEEAKNHPQKNMITRAVGTDSNIEIDISETKYKKGEIMLLCTDGLFNMVDDNEVKNIIKDSDSLLDAAESLIDKAKQNGGLDNISVIIIKF